MVTKGGKKKFGGIVGWLAWNTPVGDYGEAENFLMFLTGFVLVAPILSIGITLIIDMFINLDTYPGFAIASVTSLVFCELVIFSLIYRASKLAEDEEFSNYKLEAERENASWWNSNNDR